MVLLAALMGSRMKAWVMVMFGIFVIVSLEWLAFRPEPGFVQLLFQPGSLQLFGHSIGGAYALLPWFGVAAFGYGLAPWLVRSHPNSLSRLGVLFLLIFVGYRWFQLSDPSPWTIQSNQLFTVADFMNPSKYPPSVCYVLMTLGVAFLLLSGPARSEGTINRVLTVFGRVPMFFYLIHLPAAHLMGNLYAWSIYGQARVPSSEPVSIALILTAWVMLLAILWPMCRRWDALKRRRRDLVWLRYL